MVQKIWITKDNRVIPVREMTDEHIVNTLAYFRKRVGRFRRREEAAGLAALAFLQGEMAIASVESQLDSYESMTDDEFLSSVIPHWGNVLSEAHRRKLEPHTN